MTNDERTSERARLLALADSADSASVAQRIAAAGIRENLSRPRGTLRRAQEAAATLVRLRLAD